MQGLGIYRTNNNGLIDAELAAYDEGFRLLEEKLSEIENEYNIETATCEGLDRYEALVGLTQRPFATTADRRMMIKYRLGLNTNGFTGGNFLRSLKAAGVIVSLSQFYAGESLGVDISRIIDPSMGMAQVERLIEQLAPAHIAVTINYGKLTFDMLDGKDKNFDYYDSKDFDWDSFDLRGEVLFE